MSIKQEIKRLIEIELKKLDPNAKVFRYVKATYNYDLDHQWYVRFFGHRTLVGYDMVCSDYERIKKDFMRGPLTYILVRCDGNACPDWYSLRAFKRRLQNKKKTPETLFEFKPIPESPLLPIRALIGPCASCRGKVEQVDGVWEHVNPNVKCTKPKPKKEGSL